MIYHCHKSKD